MIKYTVIVENDETEWDDDTGVRYHFPKRYGGLLTPGTKLLHYKGKIKDTNFRSKRLSDEPHYFAFSTAGAHFSDPKSVKGDLFVGIQDFKTFESPVLHRIDGETLEEIPESRKTNFWRDGVRTSNLEIFEKVAKLAGIGFDEGDQASGSDSALTTEIWEGNKRLVFGTRYERKPELRAEAIRLHGTTCLACEADLGAIYGDFAKGHIHIHHKKPLSLSGPTVVNAATDLVPLCPNCHAMVHLGNKLRSVNEIRAALRKEPTELGV